MDFENTKLAGYKLLFGILFPESSYIYKPRTPALHPLAAVMTFSVWVTVGRINRISVLATFSLYRLLENESPFQAKTIKSKITNEKRVTWTYGITNIQNLAEDFVSVWFLTNRNAELKAYGKSVFTHLEN